MGVVCHNPSEGSTFEEEPCEYSIVIACLSDWEVLPWGSEIIFGSTTVVSAITLLKPIIVSLDSCDLCYFLLFIHICFVGFHLRRRWRTIRSQENFSNYI